MDKKTLMKDIGYKLRKIRESSRYRPHEMADFLGTWQSTYSRYEKGETPLNIITLYKLANRFNISLDWLIRGKGPMYYNEKEVGQKSEPDHTEQQLLQILGEDVKELLEHMVQIKLLRYEILVYFQKFKEKHKTKVDAAKQKESIETKERAR